MQLRSNKKEAQRGITTNIFITKKRLPGYKRLHVSLWVAAKKYMTTRLRKLISPQIHTQLFEWNFTILYLILKYLVGGNQPKLDLHAPNATVKQSCNNDYLLSQRLQACQKFIHGASTTIITEWYKKAVQPSYRILELGFCTLSAFVPT